MSNLYKHALIEFRALNGGKKFENGHDAWIQRDVLKLIKEFSRHGHSGSTAPYAVSLFSKLARFEPLAPLTGESWEWVSIGKDEWQNVRCSHVFMDSHGFAYDIDGIIFREPNGSCFTNIHSRLPVFFPYTPVRFYVDVQP